MKRNFVLCLSMLLILFSCDLIPFESPDSGDEEKDFSLYQTLEPKDPEIHLNFGTYIDMNGSTAAIAMVDSLSSGGGLIKLYKKDTHDNWAYTEDLPIPYAAYGNSNHSSIEIDGNLIATGSWNIPDSLNDEIHVFLMDSSPNWKNNPTILTVDCGNSTGRPQLGRPSLLLQDGLLILGAPAATNPNGFYGGAVYIFEHGGENQWELIQTLYPDSPETLPGFGKQVALWNYELAIGELGTGRVRIFKRNTSTSQWEYFSTITDPDRDEHVYFGRSLLYENGRLIASAIDNDYKTGSVYVFQDGQLEDILTSPDTNEIYFGSRLAMEGDDLLISSPINNDKNQGIAHRFKKGNSNKWVHQQTFLPPEGQDFGWFGSSICLSDDLIMISAHSLKVDELNETGSVFVYRR